MVSYIKLNLRTISLKSESLLSRGRSRLSYTGASFSRLFLNQTAVSKHTICLTLKILPTVEICDKKLLGIIGSVTEEYVHKEY